MDWFISYLPDFLKTETGIINQLGLICLLLLWGLAFLGIGLALGALFFTSGVRALRSLESENKLNWSRLDLYGVTVEKQSHSGLLK